MAKAIIGKTQYGTFGIVWRDFDVLENRGGYSGPYKTQDEADESARSWCEPYDEPLTIEHVESIEGYGPQCAVKDCENQGRPQICPYDQRYHHHGRIHYDTIPSKLTFTKDRAWRFVCDEHYAVLKDELALRQRA